VDKLHREVDRKKYVDAWLVEYNKPQPAHAKLEWSDTFRTTYGHKFTGYASQVERYPGEEFALRLFREGLLQLLKRSTPKTLVQRLSSEAKSVLRDQFTVLTTEDAALYMNDRAQTVRQRDACEREEDLCEVR
jgi:hypothetical protein